MSEVLLRVSCRQAHVRADRKTEREKGKKEVKGSERKRRKREKGKERIIKKKIVEEKAKNKELKCRR